MKIQKGKSKSEFVLLCSLAVAIGRMSQRLSQMPVLIALGAAMI